MHPVLRELSLTQKASSVDKDAILSLEAKIHELEGMLEDKELEQAFHDSLKLELKRVNEDLSSKKYEIECMEKGIESSNNIFKREIDALSSGRLKLIEANSHLQEIISKKDSEIAELSNPPPLPINNLSQKLPGWVNDDLRPLIYNHGLENKVVKLDKSFARENILKALQELLPRDEMVSRSQTDILPDQSIYS
ncbi:unnamed protein product [Rhizophagus irregularis]|nr:unnamed protein product [Rhizophagus irregularis]